MNRNVTKAMLEYAPVNERIIIRARFQAKQGKLTIIQCYAPTNEADAEEKTDFYLTLQSEIEKVPKHDVTIVMAGLNAKVRNDNTGKDSDGKIRLWQHQRQWRTLSRLVWNQQFSNRRYYFPS
jgi:exonuclease III